MPPEYFFPTLGMGFALVMTVIGTVRWYLRERLKADARRHSLTELDHEVIHALEDRIAELEERVDFHERVIDRQRKQLEAGQ